jgi:hypothetical protein
MAKVIGNMLAIQIVINAAKTLTYALLYLPKNYDITKRYPLFLFLHGAGEAGTGLTGLNALINTSLPQSIAGGMIPQGKDPNGVLTDFIIVAPQAPSWSYQDDAVVFMLPDILKNYAVDPTRVYVGGLSAGGCGTWKCVVNATLAQQIAAALPISAAGIDVPAASKLVYDPTTNQSFLGTQGTGIWGIAGQGDVYWNGNSGVQTFINEMNGSAPAPLVKGIATPIVGAGHDSNAWNPPFRMDWYNNSNNQLKINVWDWLLKFSRPNAVGVLPVGTNPPPPPVADPVTPVTSTTGSTGTTTPTTTTTPPPIVAPPPVAPPPVTASKIVLPAKMRASLWVAMNQVQNENTGDPGDTGQDVGYIKDGSWMDYNVNVPVGKGGKYKVTFRVASPIATGSFELHGINSVLLASVAVPNTGAWQVYQDVVANIVLPEGDQTLRILSVKGNWNITTMNFEAIIPAPTRKLVLTVLVYDDNSSDVVYA